MKVSTSNITQTSAPAVEPISLPEAKVHCRADGGDHDTLLVGIIKAVRHWIEKEYQISLVQRTYRADLWAFHRVIELPLPPLASISSIKYYNTDSPQVLTTLDSSIYITDLGRNQIYVDPAYTGSLPSVAKRHDAVQITFVAGYAPAYSPQDYAANVPDAIKAGMKLHIGDLFENREVNTQLRMQRLDSADMLLARFRKY